ncbi:MAG: aspartate dehydrogenase [Methanomicrobiales archaeon]|nr:nadX [Methanomicrobia archaeon]MDD1634199.1 aspartate dehydrogenase [Methanomicrobiales archaeon]
MIRIGLMGCGNVGQIVATQASGVEILALYDRIPGRAEELARACGGKAFPDFESFIRAPFTLVVEAASVEAVQEYGEEILAQGKDMVMLSVGAMADPGFRERIVDLARREGRKIYIPSGAILGLDNLKVGRIAPLDHLLLRTTKHPSSLKIRADRKMKIFSGKANDCIRQFPKNINVAVALSLAAGRDADVEIWVDPDATRNTHEIEARGPFGDVYIRVSNIPSPDNPATSYLAALSILTLLRNLEEPLVVGT